MLQALPEGIQGASQQALPATGRAPRTLSPAFRQAKALGPSLFRLPVTQKPVRRQQCTFAVSVSHEAPPSKSHASSSNTPAKAIVIGASVAGLLTAAALSDYVDTVTVLDKDALVSEKLSHDELKQVASKLAPGSGFVHAVTSKVTAAFSEGCASKPCLDTQSSTSPCIRHWSVHIVCSNSAQLGSSTWRGLAAAGVCRSTCNCMGSCLEVCQLDLGAMTALMSHPRMLSFHILHAALYFCMSCSGANGLCVSQVQKSKCVS